eukprot:XP_001707695.1 Hypothetical protein GL50803_4082 [Giardia lamblia ATCC 50803]
MHTGRSYIHLQGSCMARHDTISALRAVLYVRDLQGPLLLRYDANGAGPHARQAGVTLFFMQQNRHF